VSYVTVFVSHKLGSCFAVAGFLARNFASCFRVQCLQDIETLGWNPFTDMFLICVIHELSPLYL
jgi:hypothetical protein